MSGCFLDNKSKYLPYPPEGRADVFGISALPPPFLPSHLPYLPYPRESKNDEDP